MDYTPENGVSQRQEPFPEAVKALPSEQDALHEHHPGPDKHAADHEDVLLTVVDGKGAVAALLVLVDLIDLREGIEARDDERGSTSREDDVPDIRLPQHAGNSAQSHEKRHETLAYRHREEAAQGTCLPAPAWVRIRDAHEEHRQPRHEHIPAPERQARERNELQPQTPIEFQRANGGWVSHASYRARVTIVITVVGCGSPVQTDVYEAKQCQKREIGRCAGQVVSQEEYRGQDELEVQTQVAEETSQSDEYLLT